MPKLSPVEASLRTIARRQAYPGASAASAQRAGTLCATFPAQAGTAAPKRCGCCKSYTRIKGDLSAPQERQQSGNDRPRRDR